MEDVRHILCKHLQYTVISRTDTERTFDSILQYKHEWIIQHTLKPVRLGRTREPVKSLVLGVCLSICAYFMRAPIDSKW